ncbi:hypothetical protein [Streptomyces sp. CB01201]|uniref:hypothetical protein n=1 Tax=Streptomyces sp. CB01201 TaxID=2020324 RepID=UPI00131CF794|nr:hypothetical protein [Streptomyces sp. CB01201]
MIRSPPAGHRGRISPVPRRLHALLERRVVHLDVGVAAAALGCHPRVKVWLRVDPSAVENVGRTRAREPGIAFAAAVSGTCSIHGNIYDDIHHDDIHSIAHCRDLDEVFGFPADRIGSLAG